MIPTPAEERRLSAAALSWSAANRDKDNERRNRWSCAAQAFQIVGKRDGLTEQLAKLLAITHTAVEQMAGAYAIFATLYKFDPRRAWACRRRCSYHRFFTLGTLWLKYEFSSDLLFEYLESDLDTSKLKMEVTNQHDPTPEWQRKATSLLPTMKNFEEWGGVSLRLRRLARLWKAEMERL